MTDNLKLNDFTNYCIDMSRVDNCKLSFKCSEIVMIRSVFSNIWYCMHEVGGMTGVIYCH